MTLSEVNVGDLYIIKDFNRDFFVEVDLIGVIRGAVILVEETHPEGPIRFIVNQRRITMTMGACKMIEVEKVK